MIVGDAWNLRLGAGPFFYDRSLPNIVHIEREPLDAYAFSGEVVDSHIAALEYDGRIAAGAVTKVRAPNCGCCGATVYMRPGTDGEWRSHGDSLNRIEVAYAGRTMWRCGKHVDRNPCAVEGCRKTADSRGYYADDVHLCGQHWKIACPPGSAARRVYNRLFQLHRRRDGKGQPWSTDLDRRYWRVWGTIVRRARDGTAGDLDMAEINAMFGWDA